MEWWDDLWLNEGFASFMEHIGTNHSNPEFAIWDFFALSTASVLETDSSYWTHAIELAVDDPDAIDTPGDGIDQDCDGGDACFADLDGDGFRDSSGGTVLSLDDDCTDEGEAGAAVPATDCDDSDATVNPDAFDYVADGKDSDCDGYELCYTDVDGDGYRPASGITTHSSDVFCDGEGEALPDMPPTDCDDFSASVRPDAAEVIGDGVDSNCDGYELCYVDADGDGFAAGELTIESIDAYCTSVGEAGADAPRGDCDDADASINPGATEIAGDGIDVATTVEIEQSGASPGPIVGRHGLGGDAGEFLGKSNGILEVTELVDEAQVVRLSAS